MSDKLVNETPTVKPTGKTASKTAPKDQSTGGLFGLLLLAGFVAVAAAVALNTDASAGVELPPPRVQHWLEQGQRLPVRVAGVGEAMLFAVVLGTKQRSETVILVPDWVGGTSTTFSFRALASLLETAGFRVITADFPGRGLSPASLHTLSVPQLLDALVRTTGTRAAHLVLAGGSFAEAIPWISVNAGKVRSVVLAGVSGDGTAALTLPTVFSLTPPLLAPAWGWWPLRTLAVAWLQSHATPSFDSALLADSLFLVGQPPNATTGVSVAQHTENMAVYARMNVPTLRLHGGGVLHGGAVQSASGPGSARLPVGAALPFEARPADTATLIADFINAQDKTPALPVEEIPAHVLAQLKAGGGAHGHAHGPSCNH